MVMEHWYNVALFQCGDAVLFWVKFRLSWEISDIEMLILLSPLLSWAGKGWKMTTTPERSHSMLFATWDKESLGQIAKTSLRLIVWMLCAQVQWSELGSLTWWWFLPPWQHSMRRRQMAQRRCSGVYHRRPGTSHESESVDAVITRMPQRDVQQENDTCMQFSSTACVSLNLCPLPLSFNSSFCSSLFWFHTRNLPIPSSSLLPSPPIFYAQCPLRIFGILWNSNVSCPWKWLLACCFRLLNPPNQTCTRWLLLHSFPPCSALPPLLS